MYDIRNMSIWEQRSSREEIRQHEELKQDLAVLNLSVRSYNCLKRAGCETVADVLRLAGDEEDGDNPLRKVRNLGARSEAEIRESVKQYRELLKVPQRTASGGAVPAWDGPAPMIKPCADTMNRRVDEFDLSERALSELYDCGVRKVGNLWRSTLQEEPGWYAVRELFEKLPRNR